MEIINKKINQYRKLKSDIQKVSAKTFLGLIVCLAILSFSMEIKALDAEYIDFQSFNPLNPGESTGNLILGGFSYFDYYYDGILSSIDDVVEDTVEATVFGKPLVYPNPLKFSEGMEIGYTLSKDMDIEIRMYDMRANEIFRQFYPAGSNGALTGYNSINLTLADFGNYNFPSGVYFFIMINQGKVIGKGKFGVRP